MNFDGKQILSTFVEMEKGVSKYYADIAKAAEDDKTKKLFERLSLEEAKHMEMYTKLLERHGADLVREFSEEEINYTNALLHENIESKHEYLDSMSFRDAILLAEKMEKNGILFVHQMMELYPDVAKKEMKAILREEKQHLQIVRERMQFGTLRGLGL